MDEREFFGLGRTVWHDERSRNFPAPSDQPVVTHRWRRVGAVLDQGQLGSCTGNAGCQALNHVPFHVVGSPLLRESDAISVYSGATERDPYTGTYPPEDTGSSGLAVAQELQARGLIASYTHAFGLDHVLSALQVAPLIVGTNWYRGMFYPASTGQVSLTGDVVGGHEYVADAVYVEDRLIRFLNSWGSSWGVYGHFFMTFDDFSRLLSEDGDATQFTR